MSTVRVRPAERTDAACLAEMMNRLSACEGTNDTLHSEALVLDHCFGLEPAYSALLAEMAGGNVGYTSYHDAYFADLAARGFWMVDLFVEESVRGRGVGRALVRAVAQRASAIGRNSVCWAILPSNRQAWEFCEALGAKEDLGRMMGLHGAALQALAGPQSD